MIRLIVVNQENAEAIEIRATQPYDDFLIEKLQDTPESELKHVPVVKQMILDKWTQEAFDHPHVIKVHYVTNYELRRI